MRVFFFFYILTWKKELLTFLELLQIFIWCKSQVLGVLIVEVHLYFFSLSFFMSSKFTLELSLPGQSRAPPALSSEEHVPCADQAEQDGFPSLPFPDDF